MDNMNVNLLASSTKEIKADKSSVKSLDSTSKDAGNTFDSQLSKIKDKETKTAKSVIREATKDLAVSKSLDIKVPDEIENKEAIENMILSLINSVLQIPVEEIKQILQEMNIEPTDLLTGENFKEFLTYAYPEYNENQLLFNEDKLKDISKLFAKFEHINTLIEGQQSNTIVEKLIVGDEVVKTTTTEVNVNKEEVGEESNAAQIAPQVVQDKANLSMKTLSNNLVEEAVPEGNLSDEGLLNFKQMGIGITVPIQAFNTTMNTQLWDVQAAKTEVSQFLQQNALTNQIINKLDITTLGNHKEITMELSPKELGNLSIKLVENNGVLVANIRVESEKTKDLLLNDIKQLEQTLEKQGLSISEVRVDVRQNPHQSQMEQQRQKSARRIQEIIDKHLLEDQEANMQVDEVTGELIETEVNYMI